MRIIAGLLKGRNFNEPHGHKTHPMSDKARGALFNVLGDIDSLTFLDAFAGSGALALEAVSRGAKSVVAVEIEKSAHFALSRSVEELGLTKEVRAVKANVAGWSIHNMEKKFDILLLDPPHDNMQPVLLEKLVKRHAKPGGIVILSLPRKTDVSLTSNLEPLASKSYGDIQLVFYRKTK